ncbi:hypothetical protein EMCRGX_G015248 [Ephydatia muelleri]
MSTYTQSFCSCCERSRHRAITAKTEVVHHRCSVKPLFQWEMHSDQECKFQARTILEQLTCQVCLKILQQPLELLCAPDLILVLLNDILVLCVKCNREMKAHSYEGHECTSCLTASEERTVAGILKRAVSTSPDKTGDSVTNLHVTLDRFKDQVEHLHGMKWSDEMATPLSIRGYATRRTLETIGSDHQHYVAAGSIRREAQKLLNSISLPIFNIPVSQVCPPGLHITLAIFTKLFHLLEAACHQLDLELALHITDFTGPSSSFSKYSQELQNLSFLQAELEKAQQSHEELQNMATYMALVNGEKSPLAVNLIKQSAAKMKSVKALKAKVAKGIATVQKGFSEKEGPFVKQLDRALQLIGVQCQQYFGGAFVGNHVHKALKLPNVKTLCTAISQMAQEKLPHRSGEVAENMKNFINLFSLFGKCHNISDQNFIDEPQIHALGQAIEEFMAFFQQQQSQSKCT